MADTVPVRDVLSEAMEYLSKLGSNLRVRSENLKEKRLRKDKLRNSHAVQKTASKVLLICELSKKSIENVETGVKKILKQIVATQASDSDSENITSHKSSNVDSDIKYEYISYMSRKLKIRNKINLKHFTSVKVVAKAMSSEFQEKYSVFYDCKLYRKRKKNNKSIVTIESSNNISLIEQKEPDNDIPVTTTSEVTEEVKISENSDAVDKDNKKSTSLVAIGESDPRHSDKDKMIKTKKKKANKKKIFKNIVCHNDSSDSEKQIQKSPEKEMERSPEKGIEKNPEIERERSPEKGIEKNPEKEIEMCPEKEIKKSPEKEIVKSPEKEIGKSPEKVLSEIQVECETSSKDCSRPKISTSDEIIPEILTTSLTDVEDTSKVNLSDSILSVRDDMRSEDKQCNEPLSDNSEVPKSQAAIDDEVKDSAKKNKKAPPCTVNKTDTNTNTGLDFDIHNLNGDNKEKDDSVEKGDVIEKDNVIEKEKSIEKDENVEKDDSIVKEPTSKQNLDTNETSQSSSDSKPFIKCVNINKLLKDNINIHVVESDSDKELSVKKRKKKADTNKKNQQYNHNERKPLKAGKKFKSEKQTKTKDDNEYWKLKRNEVKKFKAKQFSINVMRLPILSQEFLNKHNLKQIVQNGAIVCQCLKLSDDGNKKDKIECEKSIPASKQATTDIANTLSVKSSLLNDSDSDDNENLKKTAENISKGLGKKSDKNSSNIPDTNDNKENNSLEDRNKSKTPDPVNQCSENKDIFKSPQNDQIKNILLNDSTDENSPNKKKKNESDGSSPPSKRKHIMESMHAKKMLLTYSSSSDTDDEELKDALKQIRDYLLNGNSSDDENKEDKTDKGPSESDASSVCLKRKHSRSRSVSSLDETTKKKKVSESESSTKKSSQTEDNIDEKSTSSSKKMGRSKSNPGSSTQNSDSQDTYDKEIDRLTNLKSLKKKHRRRDSTSTITTQRSSRSSRRMPKPCISEEGFLKAESSSDNASVPESDEEYEAGDLPTVTLSGLNGDGIGHLAKDDLLEESLSSSSHNKSSTDDKKADSEEGHVKSKSRRKVAISSDSEAGSSRKKTAGVKMSDFEDSEDDSEPKKTKRKKKGSESDASAGSSLDESKKKRRRIKNVDDSDSGSETETEGRNKHGRKNIRKVMSKNQLEEATKKAAREEKERIARITERQKLYNNLEFDESGKPDEVVLDKVVLDFDPDTKEPLIEVDKGLVKKLKPHQANGIKFMWNACFESVKRIKKDKGSGCILAHCMGLGKTLQVVSLTHTLLTHSSLTGVNRVLVVCPLSTVLNWVNEFGIWLKHTDKEYEVDVYELSRYKQNSERSYQLSQWFSGGGVCVLGYEMFRNLSSDSNKKLKKKMMKSFQESLVEPGPDLVVCDEGHLLKNEKTSLSQAMNRVRTLRRIVLTGTPLQNNLKEYYCMVQFVKPNLLGKYNEYLNRFVNPITNGQYTDSTEHDIRIMKRRSHVLHKMLDGAVQRRDYGVLAPFLPPKHEYVLFITLTEVQIKLYQHYLDNYSRRPLAGKSSGFLFPDFQSLQRIWTHPLVLKYNSERYEIMQQKKREREEEDSEGSLADFIDDDSTPDESSTEESSDSLSDESDDSRKKSKKKKSAKKSKGKDSKITTRRGTRANPDMADEEVVSLETRDMKTENPTEWWMTLVTEDELDDLRHSHKLVLLFDILRQCEAIGDKLLVFSQSLYSLDLIEHFLSKVDDATQEGRVDEKLNGHVGTWSPGLDYFRLDGSTSCENRSIWCKNFNREDNPRARLFLISTRAGGLGINLVAANRVVIFDVSWNPSHDVQSIFRVYRFGQKKPCYIYRFLAMGTMEEKIYERQVTKQAISKRVIDEQQIDRHYAENDLAELYKFEPNPPPREIPPLPKDRLFAEMLKEHEKQIYKYHEHDSLLENKEEETLTEEERKAAWEDFENEKTRPPPAPLNYNMHNGMMQGIFAQQYATIAAMLRKETPNITDSQIRDMQTLLYNSNSAALMGEIYKYAQPAMMNQRMMTPGMVNPGGGGGMGVGGSSGLQYDPPWQRQQQLRMQQLMQQQNMGAKYYAGGLGSRDPMAMALQQQRARELMLGERSRPRGRPPGRAAAATLTHSLGQHTTTTDVVNLDSD